SEIKVDGRGLLVLSFYKMSGFGQSSFLQPMARCHAEYLMEITLETSQASPCKPGKFFNRNVIMKIIQHKFFQIDLIGLRKIEQKFFELRHGIKQQIYDLFYF